MTGKALTGKALTGKALTGKETAAHWRARTWATVERLRNEQPSAPRVVPDTATRRDPRRVRSRTVREEDDPSSSVS